MVFTCKINLLFKKIFWFFTRWGLFLDFPKTCHFWNISTKIQKSKNEMRKPQNLYSSRGLESFIPQKSSLGQIRSSHMTFIRYYKTHMIFGICLETVRHIGQITSKASTRQESIFEYQSGFYGPWNRDQTSVTIGVKNFKPDSEKKESDSDSISTDKLTSLGLND